MSDTGKRTNARAASVSTTDGGGGTRGDYPRMDTTKQTQTGHKTKQAQTRAAKVRRRPTEPPAAKPPAPGSSSATSGNQLTLVGATALVIGSIVGVGIFNLPSSLAPYGPITLISLGLTTIGALALARLFASLARRMPAPGGPYAYARVASPSDRAGGRIRCRSRHSLPWRRGSSATTPANGMTRPASSPSFTTGSGWRRSSGIAASRFTPTRDRLAFARFLIDAGCQPPPDSRQRLDGAGQR